GASCSSLTPSARQHGRLLTDPGTNGPFLQTLTGCRRASQPEDERRYTTTWIRKVQLGGANNREIAGSVKGCDHLLHAVEPSPQISGTVRRNTRSPCVMEFQPGSRPVHRHQFTRAGECDVRRLQIRPAKTNVRRERVTRGNELHRRAVGRNNRNPAVDQG